MTRPQPRGAWATGAEEAGGSPLTSDFCLETSVPAAGRGHETQHRKVPPGTSCVFRGDFRHTKFITIFFISWTRLGPKVTWQPGGDTRAQEWGPGVMRYAIRLRLPRWVPASPPGRSAARALSCGTAWQLPAQPGCFVNS